MQLKPITAIIILLLLVASLLVAGCATSTSDNTANTATYQPVNNAQSGKTTFTSSNWYSIVYPTTWWNGTEGVTEKQFLDLFLKMNSNAINGLIFYSQPLNATTGTTLKSFSDYSMNGLSLYKDFSLSSYESATISGQPAYKAVWQATVPQQISANNYQYAQIKVTEYYVIHNGRGYIIIYKTITSDYDTYLSQAQEIINSFNFTS